MITVRCPHCGAVHVVAGLRQGVTDYITTCYDGCGRRFKVVIRR